MKRNGQSAPEPPVPAGPPRAIAPVPYRPTPGVPPGVEVADFARLAERVEDDAADLFSPRRPGFHELLAVSGGRLGCSVDFRDCEAGPGDWLWVRPGQVVRFRTRPDDAQGTVVLFPAGFVNTRGAVAAGNRSTPCRPITPAEPDRSQLASLLDALGQEYRRLGDLPLDDHIEVMRHLTSALMIRLAHVEEGAPGPYEAARGEAFRRFREAVEEGFAHTHRVEDYARRLGYSVRTLTRATREAAGVGAKRFIDERVLLEAKRMLVHTSAPSAEIGSGLGFPEATTFSAFFRRHTGLSPSAFRRETTGAGTTVAAGPAPGAHRPERRSPPRKGTSSEERR